MKCRMFVQLVIACHTKNILKSSHYLVFCSYENKLINFVFKWHLGLNHLSPTWMTFGGGGGLALRMEGDIL